MLAAAVAGSTRCTSDRGVKHRDQLACTGRDVNVPNFAGRSNACGGMVARPSCSRLARWSVLLVAAVKRRLAELPAALHHDFVLYHLQYFVVTWIVGGKEGAERDWDSVHSVGRAGPVDAVDCGGETYRGHDRRLDGGIV
jgi:hypothetical protein